MILLFKDYKTDMFEAVKEIRRGVFLDEQGAQSEAVLDRLDALDTTRFALCIDSDNNAVATGRIVKYKDGVKIGRIAVLKTERGKGTGKKLVEFLCSGAEDLGAKKVYVDSQLHAVEFYKKLGFEPTGEDEIYDIGKAHLPMVKTIDKE